MSCIHNAFLAEFKVQVSYRGDSDYELGLVSDEGGESLHTRASGNIQLEEVVAGTTSLKLNGLLKDRRVSANIAVVEDQVHIFNKVMREREG